MTAAPRAKPRPTCSRYGTRPRGVSPREPGHLRHSCVEPHHDGTPHWHLLLWMKPEHTKRVNEILRSHAEADTPEELFDRRGNKTTARFKVEKIDYQRGTAAGYVAKYISKNINGEQFVRDGVKNDDKDRYGHELNSAAPRIESWAAVWGIRQFQFVGLPSVTVWREVRRLNEKHIDELESWEQATRPDKRIAGRLEQIRKAANAGQWDQFLRLMGGPNLPRKQRPVKPWTMPRVDLDRAEFSHATGEVREGIEPKAATAKASWAPSASSYPTAVATNTNT